jgi:hypothetical protein
MALLQESNTPVFFVAFVLQMSGRFEATSLRIG